MKHRMLSSDLYQRKPDVDKKCEYQSYGLFKILISQLKDKFCCDFGLKRNPGKTIIMPHATACRQVGLNSTRGVCNAPLASSRATAASSRLYPVTAPANWRPLQQIANAAIQRTAVRAGHEVI